MSKNLSMLKVTPIALLLMASFAEAKTINKSFDVKQGGELVLEADVGSININTHNNNSVLVNIEIEGKNEDKVNVDFTNTNNKLSIISEYKRSSMGFFGGSNGVKVEYTLTLPEQFNVELDTSGGSISIEDLIGNVDAHTSGGSITLEKIEGTVDINTSGGSITLDDIFGPIDAHTSGGSIDVTLPKSPQSDSDIRTSGGSITAYLAKNIAVDVVAKTSGGRVKSEFNVDGEETKQSIKGQINGGGPKLILKTSGGSVRLKEI